MCPQKKFSAGYSIFSMTLQDTFKIDPKRIEACMLISNSCLRQRSAVEASMESLIKFTTEYFSLMTC